MTRFFEDFEVGAEFTRRGAGGTDAGG